MPASQIFNYTEVDGFILNKLADKPYDTNQLAEALNIDYQTTSHHLDVLANNGIITTEGDKYGKTYSLSEAMEVPLSHDRPLRGNITPKDSRD